MFRFGIFGVSGITPKFVEAARLAGCEVTAISSRSEERARAFAEKYQIAHFYGSYEEMAEKEPLDCAYINTIPVAHYPLVMLCLEHNIPVLCEKAMFCSSAEAESAFSLARSKNLFAMEALWSKFLPANREAKRWLEEGKIGKPVLCDSMLGWRPDVPRFFRPELGGGPSYDLTVYAYEIMAFLLGCEPEITDVQVSRHPSGVNFTEMATLRAGECLCTMRVTYNSPNEDGIVLMGEYGRIELPRPHISTVARLRNQDGLQMEFTDRRTQNGFVYEIEETVRCIAAGKIESDVQPHSATLACAKLFDAIREASAR